MKRMKKIFLFALCITLLICLSACNSSPSQQNNNSFEITQAANEIPLIRTLTATDTVDAIKSFEIIHEYNPTPTEITDKNDLKFLEKYTYSHIYPSDKLHELFLFPNNYRIIIKLNASENTLYLMKDGSIVKQQMCGDSGVTDVPFEVYTADNQYMLTHEKLIELLKKYDAYNK